MVVPADPWDFTGHVDGLVRFIDKGRVLVNETNSLDNKMKSASPYEQEKYNLWKRNFRTAVENAGFIIKKLPCAAGKNDNDTSAVGIYLNFLKMGDKIIMPSYKELNGKNDDVEKILHDFYDLPVKQIEATELAKKGGIINCVTWTK